MEFVAWLALAVAVSSLGWQVYEARERRRARIAVQVHHLAVPASVPDAELLAIPSLGLDQRMAVWPAAADERLSYVLAIVAVNEGATTESVEDMRMEDVKGQMGSGAAEGAGPRALTPRNRVTWAFRPERLPFDAERGFNSTVLLSSGSRITTGPHHLDPELSKLIADHNSASKNRRR